MIVFWKIKAAVLRLVSPIIFKSIGRGSMFTGRIRLPRPFSRIVIGRDCMIGHDVFFQTGRQSNICIGNDVSINSGTHIVASESIVIGSRVAIGEYVSIRDQDHEFKPSQGVRGLGFRIAPVIIEDNVWIGRGVHIGPGAHIRSGSIVAANAVVNGVFPANCLIAGVPAKVRRTILEDGKTARIDD